MTYPIILAHGVCRFDKIWSDALKIDNCEDKECEKKDLLHYFKGIRTMLRRCKYEKRCSLLWHSGIQQGVRL